MRRKNFLLAVVVVLFCCFVVSTCACWAFGRPKNLVAIEVLTGYGTAKLKELGRYRMLPFFIDFCYDIKSLAKKIGIKVPGMLQFIEEPFASFVYEPKSNAEMGNNFVVKLGFLPEKSKFQPYVKGGVGMVFLTQHTREQGTQFNFNEFAGVGAQYFFKKNLALTAEYRFRHLSNARIGHPNDGISTNFALCGLTYLF